MFKKLNNNLEKNNRIHKNVCHISEISQTYRNAIVDKDTSISLKNEHFEYWFYRVMQTLFLNHNSKRCYKYFKLFESNLSLGKDKACVIVASKILKDNKNTSKVLIRSAIKQILYFFNTQDDDVYEILLPTNYFLKI